MRVCKQKPYYRLSIILFPSDACTDLVLPANSVGHCATAEATLTSNLETVADQHVDLTAPSRNHQRFLNRSISQSATKRFPSGTK